MSLAAAMKQISVDYDSAIIGLGATGWSLARFLLGRGEHIAITDTRDQPPYLAQLQECAPDSDLALGRLDQDLLLRARRVFVSPGVSLPDALVACLRAAGVVLASDIELFCQHARSPIVAVTGSNGKSTVVTLLGECAAHAGLCAPTGGNLGPPALDLLASERPVDYYLLELSSFQLLHTHSLNAHAAVVLNFSDDHLDRHGDRRHYWQAKRHIYAGDGLMVINVDDPMVCGLVSADRRLCRYSLRDPQAELHIAHDTGGVAWLCQGSRRLLRCSQLALPGEHNLSNALACLALAGSMGIDAGDCVPVLRRFTGLAHRLQSLGHYRGVPWYNDSKATNVAATCAAVDTLAGSSGIILLAGGDAKGADFAPLAAACVGRVRHALLFGRDAACIEAQLTGRLPCTRVADLAAAVRHAARLATPGDSVLLSPACASSDAYVDYQARGEDFIRQVQALGDGS